VNLFEEAIQNIYICTMEKIWDRERDSISHAL